MGNVLMALPLIVSLIGVIAVIISSSISGKLISNAAIKSYLVAFAVCFAFGIILMVAANAFSSQENAASQNISNVTVTATENETE